MAGTTSLGSVDPSSTVARRATRLTFFVAGFAGASWAPLVPFVKARCHLTNGALGSLLLCLGLGSIIAMPLAGAASVRHGCRLIVTIATLTICCTLPILAWSSSVPALAVALILFGAGVGTGDCLVNVQAVIVERASGRVMMSGFHALFSVGGIVGAACVSGLLNLGVAPVGAAWFAVVAVAAAYAVARAGLLDAGVETAGRTFVVPRGVVLAIGAMCFVVFLTEGAALDWSAVFMSTIRKMDRSLAGLAYATFATTMTLGRLSGDRVVRRFGRRLTVVVGGAVAVTGLATIATVPVWQGTLVGYALVGAGCSNIVPVLYTAIGRQKRMPEHLAVPAITTLGYSGILAGPALIGFAADLTSLPAAIALVGLAMVGVTLAGLRLDGL